jgi:hypothetical protein
MQRLWQALRGDESWPWSLPTVEPAIRPRPLPLVTGSLISQDAPVLRRLTTPVISATITGDVKK